jgi:peptidoglycan/xylan/chitin deacetylase (PgdA/CDA1 family)
MKRLLAVLTAISLAVSCVPGAKAGNTKEAAGYIALTFDDGPSGAITETLLDGLAARNVKATFFLCGYRIEKFPEIAQRMAEEGHELGLHSNRHDYMQHMTKEEALDDLSECQSILTETTGVSARLFRPPGGLYSQDLLDASRELGLSIVFWSVDPHDWDKKKSSQVLLSHASAGDIILMHDLTEHSVSAALSFIDTMYAKGYEFCTVSELAALSGETLSPGTYYNRFPH